MILTVPDLPGSLLVLDDLFCTISFFLQRNPNLKVLIVIPERLWVSSESFAHSSARSPAFSASKASGTHISRSSPWRTRRTTSCTTSLPRSLFSQTNTPTVFRKLMFVDQRNVAFWFGIVWMLCNRGQVF